MLAQINDTYNRLNKHFKTNVSSASPMIHIITIKLAILPKRTGLEKLLRDAEKAAKDL